MRLTGSTFCSWMVLNIANVVVHNIPCVYLPSAGPDIPHTLTSPFSWVLLVVIPLFASSFLFLFDLCLFWFTYPLSVRETLNRPTNATGYYCALTGVLTARPKIQEKREINGLWHLWNALHMLTYLLLTDSITWTAQVIATSKKMSMQIRKTICRQTPLKRSIWSNKKAFYSKGSFYKTDLEWTKGIGNINRSTHTWLEI